MIVSSYSQAHPAKGRMCLFRPWVVVAIGCLLVSLILVWAYRFRVFSFSEDTLVDNITSIDAQRQLAARGSEAVPCLLRAIQEKYPPGHRSRGLCVAVLGQIGAPEALPILIELCVTDPNRDNRLYAIGALKEFSRNAEITATLRRIMISDPDEVVRCAARELLESN